MNPILNILKDETLTYHQQLMQLAAQSENSLDVLAIDAETQSLMDDNIICTLHEGNAPYRPRYIVPDYSLLMKKGSSFLRLDPPTDIWEATQALLVMYHHVPSITSYPVYLGNLDTLLEPFVEDEDMAYKAIQLFLQHIDRTLTDSFVHANIGPIDTKAGRLILKAMRENPCDIPNLTVKVAEGVTSDDFLKACAQTALMTAKPSFANHMMNQEAFGDLDYALVSCYNGLPIGGGGYTLQRLLLHNAALKATSVEDFMDRVLPHIAQKLLGLLDTRIGFLINETAFFKTNFLVTEGFIDQKRFSGMFGLVGLAEAVNTLLHAEDKSERFGHSEKANDLGLKIIQKLNTVVQAWMSPYVDCLGGHHLLHAQVGIDTDVEGSPGCRIPVGEEPTIMEHLLQSAPFHPYFFNGIGDIFVFEDTYQEHPEALVDIVKGAFKAGIRYLSAYGKGCDVVRITGYLAKRSEMEKLQKGQVVLNQATIFGLGAKNNNKALDRKLRD